MKKVCLMKVMAVLAMGLVAVSCNKMEFDQNAYQQAKEQESKESFINNVMGGQQIDPNQNWKTTVTANVAVTSQLSGTLKIFTANPHGTVAAALLSQDIEAGSYNFTVTKPKDAEKLYAKLTLADGSVKVVEIIDDAVSFLASGKSNTTKSAVKSNRAARRAATFPDAPDWSTIPTTVPGTAINEDLYYTTMAGDFFVSTSDTQINMWMGNSNLYFDRGTYNITSIDVNNNTNIYLLAGANVTFSNGFAIKYNNVKVYVASGATFTGNINSTAEFYNKGTINAPTFNFYNANNQWATNGCGFVYNQGTINSTTEFHIDDNTMSVNANIMNVAKLVIDEEAHFLNKGTLTVDGELGVKNDASTFMNEGTVTAASVSVEGSADFFNEDTGNITISGTTTVNSNLCTWNNGGYYRTRNFIYRAGSDDVINNCKMVVDELFSIQLGAGNQSERCFKMNAKSSVVTTDFEILSVSSILMGSEAIFKVTNNAVMGITTEGKVEGIYGVGDDYAVFQAKNIVKIASSDNNHHYVTYGGNLYVAADSHFANGHDGGGMENHAYYYELDNAKVVNGQTAAPITINKNGNCSDGYTGGGGGGEDAVMYYYYAFEDLGAIGDFDFNDVVLRLSAPENGVSIVELVAAGGTLPVQVYYGDVALGNEVHVEFGVDTQTMVNTGGTTKKFVTLGPVKIDAEAAKDMANLPFSIVVTGNDGSTIKVTAEVDHTGTAPLMIVVSGYESGVDAGKWFWPRERVNISSAYTEFGDWGANVATNLDWYYHYTDGKVWKY